MRLLLHPRLACTPLGAPLDPPLIKAGTVPCLAIHGNNGNGKKGN